VNQSEFSEVEVTRHESNFYKGSAEATRFVLTLLNYSFYLLYTMSGDLHLQPVPLDYLMNIETKLSIEISIDA
jgi:hypothetical protein